MFATLSPPIRFSTGPKPESRHLQFLRLAGAGARRGRTQKLRRKRNIYGPLERRETRFSRRIQLNSAAIEPFPAVRQLAGLVKQWYGCIGVRLARGPCGRLVFADGD